MSAGGDLLLRQARAFPDDGRALDVRVRAGRIEEVAPGGRLAPRGEVVVDAAGRSVIPALLDVHVHFRDPGLAHKEGWESGSEGALHGGVTGVVEVQNNPPLTVTRAALEARIEHVRARSRVDFGCLANLLPESLDELGAMAPLTPAFKCFLGGSTGLGGMDDRAAVRALFAGAARAGRMIVAHCEDEELLRQGKRDRPDATASEHHLVRSSEAEARSIADAIDLAEETGAALHVFHVSTAAGVELIRRARARGLPIGSSTAPHYLLLSCEDAPRLGNLLKVNPSIKTPDDARAVLAGLADGTIEAIGTDHAPHPLEEKRREYKHSPSGMPSVDLLWPLVLELAKRDLLDARTALDTVTGRAAASLGIEGKGRLEPGFDGDLVLFDPEEERVVVGARLPSRSKWSAFEGWRLCGFPSLVVRRGVIAWRDGRPAEPGPGGESLRWGAPRPLAGPR